MTDFSFKGEIEPIWYIFEYWILSLQRIGLEYV